MPLEQSGTPEAVSDNIKTEVDAGKPQNQAVGIAESIKDKVQKHSESPRAGVSSRKMTGSERIPQIKRQSKPVSGNPVRQDSGDHETRN